MTLEEARAIIEKVFWQKFGDAAYDPRSCEQIIALMARVLKREIVDDRKRRGPA